MTDKQEFQRGNIITISLAHFVHDTFSSFLAPLLPLLIEKFSISYALAGFLTVVRNLPSLFNPFMGMIADKVSIRYFVISAPFITSVAMSFLGAAPSYTIVAILLFISGISASMFHVPAPVMIKDVSGIKIGRGMSYFMLGGEFARSIGPIVVLGAVSIWGLEGSYRLIIVGFLATIFLFIKFKKISPSADGSNKLKNQKQELGAIKSLKEHLRPLLLLTGVILFLSFMRGSLRAFLPTYLTLRGESLWMSGIALSVISFAGSIGSFFSGTISDKIGRRNTLLIIGIGSPLFLWLFTISNNFWMIPILIILGLFVLSANPVLLAIIMELETDRPSFLNGVFMSIMFLLNALSVFLVGVLSDLVGMIFTFKILSVLGLLAIPFIFSLKKEKSTLKD
ncbi:MAG TPA: MFS transporter [Ignavibacteria bacterium]|nr:MFS transporter [Ignavibacteria bacterium]